MMTILRMVTGVFAALAALLGRRRVAATPCPDRTDAAAPAPPDEWELPRKLTLRRAAAWHGRVAERCRAEGDEAGRRHHAGHAKRYLDESRRLEAERWDSESAAAHRAMMAAAQAPSDGAMHELVCNAFDPPGHVRVTVGDGEVRVDDGPPDGEVWVTATGKRIHPRDMGDGHLVNTIRFIRRKAHGRMTAARRAAPYDAMGDAPGMLEHIGKRRPAYEAMVREAARRGLEA